MSRRSVSENPASRCASSSSSPPASAGAARSAAAGAALGQQLRPRRAVDAAVHPAAAQEGLLGRVDDGVHVHFRDVVAYDHKGHPLTACPVPPARSAGPRRAFLRSIIGRIGGIGKGRMQKTRPGPADCRSGRAVSAKASPVAIADHSAAVYLVLLAFPCCRSRPDRTILLISRAAVDALMPSSSSASGLVIAPCARA